MFILVSASVAHFYPLLLPRLAVFRDASGPRAASSVGRSEDLPPLCTLAGRWGLGKGQSGTWPRHGTRGPRGRVGRRGASLRRVGTPGTQHPGWQCLPGASRDPFPKQSGGGLSLRTRKPCGFICTTPEISPHPRERMCSCHISTNWWHVGVPDNSWR